MKPFITTVEIIGATVVFVVVLYATFMAGYTVGKKDARFNDTWNRTHADGGR